MKKKAAGKSGKRISARKEETEAPLEMPQDPLTWFEGQFQRYMDSELTEAEMMSDFLNSIVFFPTEGKTLKKPDGKSEIRPLVIREGTVPLAPVFTHPVRAIGYRRDQFPKGYTVRANIFMQVPVNENCGIIINPGLWDFTLLPQEVRKAMRIKQEGAFVKFWKKIAGRLETLEHLFQRTIS